MKAFWNKICRKFDKASNKKVMSNTVQDIKTEEKEEKSPFEITSKLVTAKDGDKAIEITIIDTSNNSTFVKKLTSIDINASFKKSLDKLKSGS